MEKIINQTHSKETFLYTLSRLLERGSYYGLRALLILYMTESILKMELTDAYRIYSWYIFSLLFSKIIGALIGDLVIGNKKAIILGGILQALGAFSFISPSTIGLYTGLFLIALGSGLYSPNIFSNFGKIYLNKTKLLDAGFAIFYFGTNLGAFLAIISIGYIGGQYGWNTGFALTGILLLLSIIPVIISKGEQVEETIEKKANINQRIINIILALTVVSLFWVIYSIGEIRFFDLQPKFIDISTLDIPENLWPYFDLAFIVPISLAAGAIWSFFYYNPFFKLTIGYIFGAMAFAVLFLIPEIPTEKHLYIYFLSLLLLGISEIHIAPILFSIITKNSNPKYLAILFGLAAIPTKLFYGLLNLFVFSVSKKTPIFL